MRFVALALAAAVALPARADENTDQARAAFQKGQTEYNLGNYAEAAKFFEEVYRLKPVPALLFNIAQCYRFTGNLEKATQTYRAYLRNAPPTDKNQGLAKELLAQVEQALAQKQKAESSPPHGLAAAPPMSGAPVPQTAAAPPVGAQPAAAAPSTPPVAPRPAPAAAVTAAPAPPQPPSHVVTYVTGGAAVVALAGGTLFGMKSKSALSELQSGYHTTAQIDSQSASAKSDASKATAMLVAGAALAVAAGVFFALDF